MNGVRGKGTNGLTKAIYHFLQSYKHFISEPALAEFPPDLFDWIHFRRVWRNKKQTYVFRNTESARLKYIDYYNISTDYIVEVMDRITRRFTDEERETLERMLDIVDRELMPEVALPAGAGERILRRSEESAESGGSYGCIR